MEWLDSNFVQSGKDWMSIVHSAEENIGYTTGRALTAPMHTTTRGVENVPTPQTRTQKSMQITTTQMRAMHLGPQESVVMPVHSNLRHPGLM